VFSSPEATVIGSKVTLKVCGPGALMSGGVVIVVADGEHAASARSGSDRGDSIRGSRLVTVRLAAKWGHRVAPRARRSSDLLGAGADAAGTDRTTVTGRAPRPPWSRP